MADETTLAHGADLCAFETCGRQRVCKGYCDGHYRMFKRGVELHPIRKSMKQGGKKLPCSFQGCIRERDSWGYCSGHSKQITRGLAPYASPRLGLKVCAMPECIERHVGKGFCQRHYARYWTYGLSVIQATMIDIDNRPCDLCGVIGAAMAIDHDHSCCGYERRGTCGSCIRGFICYPCNQGLGNFRDNTDLMQRAIEYLESSRLAE